MTDGMGIERFDDEPEVIADDQAPPWARLWSRTFDLNLWSFPTGVIVALLFPAFAYADAFSGAGGAVLFGICLMPLIMLLDATCLAIFGNTPGRALAGIRVETARRESLNWPQSLKRNGLLYFKGLALGIPLIALATYSHNYSRLREGKQTSWDDELFTRVYSISGNVLRTTLVAAAALSMVIIGRILIQMDETASDSRGQFISSRAPISQSSIDPVAARLAEVAATVKPQMIDDITRLDGAHAAGRVFTYQYSIIRRDAADSTLGEYFRTSIIPRVCNDSSMRSDLKDYQVTYRYQYTLPNADAPLNYDINWSDCRALGH